MHKQLFGGDTGIDADFYKKNEVIYIDGYWLDTLEYFFNYKCIIGEWDGNEEDNDIFFYFKNEEDIKHFQKNNTLNDFVVTKIWR